MCEIHGKTFDEFWVGDDLAQPDRHSASSTVVTGSATVREALVDFLIIDNHVL